MQIVNRISKNIHPILDDIDQLYNITSKEPDSELLPQIFDTSFDELLDTFTIFGEKEYNIEYTDVEYQPLEIEGFNPDNIVLAFTGGKDSIAAALKYKKMGKNVFLYHMKHVNKSFSDEWECAKKCAELLGLPLHIDDIQLKGNHIWMEHPMKNMIIANGALSWGIRSRIGTNIAFGNYSSSYLDDNPFDRCAGDCVDMWETYEKIIQRIIPDFKVDITLENLGETLSIIMNPTHRELLENSLSCLCRHSLRQYRHDWVLNKYYVNLPARRCGSCYKCCVEYVYMADHNLIEFSEDYYRYCINQLLKVMIAEHTAVDDIKDLWENFMFYPIEQSKLYGGNE